MPDLAANLPRDPHDGERVTHLRKASADLDAVLHDTAALEGRIEASLHEFCRAWTSPGIGTILCQVCGTGIRRSADLVIKRRTVMHVRCYVARRAA